MDRERPPFESRFCAQSPPLEVGKRTASCDPKPQLPGPLESSTIGSTGPLTLTLKLTLSPLGGVADWVIGAVAFPRSCRAKRGPDGVAILTVAVELFFATALRVQTRIPKSARQNEFSQWCLFVA
jgi:hypothetical protein